MISRNGHDMGPLKSVQLYICAEEYSHEKLTSLPPSVSNVPKFSPDLEKIDLEILQMFIKSRDLFFLSNSHLIYLRAVFLFKQLQYNRIPT